MTSFSNFEPSTAPTFLLGLLGISSNSVNPDQTLEQRNVSYFPSVNRNNGEEIDLTKNNQNVLFVRLGLQMTTGSVIFNNIFQC